MEAGVTHNQNTLYFFDGFDRPRSTIRVIDGVNYTETTTYDEHGRVFQQFDASEQDRGTENVYNNFGYLKQIKESAIIGGNQTIYHTVDATDARGNVIQETLGAGSTAYTTTRQHSQTRGFVNSIKTMRGVNKFQHLTLTYDALGNLDSRRDQGNSSPATQPNRDLQEAFCYDNMNRLVKVKANTTSVGNCGNYDNLNGDYQYDDLGNITRKHDVGDYIYKTNGVRPHAVETAGGVYYGYDANGNMKSGGGRNVFYTTFDKPYHMKKGASNVRYRYGADRSRYIREDTVNSVTTKTRFSGNIEIITGGALNTKVIKRHIAGKAIVTLNNVSSTGTPASQNIRYLLHDHIGSTTSIMNANGVYQEMSFDPWGQRRLPTNWQTLLGNYPSNPSQFTTVTERGFTGHEMVDTIGLIHMNGRTFDPKLGRFMQADPYIDGLTNSQGHNRYSYGKNNTLNGSDPSGYGFFKDLNKALGNIDGRYHTHKYIWSQNDTLANTGQLAFNFIPVFGQLASAHFAADRVAFAGGSSEAAFYSGALAYISSDMSGEPNGWDFAFTAIDGTNPDAGRVGRFLRYGIDYSNFEFADTAAYLTREVETYYISREVGRFANKNGLSLAEFNGLLTLNSFIGNIAAGSRYHGDDGENRISGFTSRRGKPLSSLGIIWDVNDSILAFQGMLDASGFDYRRSDNVGQALSGCHSLGSLSCNNLVARGFAPSAQLNSIPFGQIAVGPNRHLNKNGRGDIVNLGIIGQIFNPASQTTRCAGGPPCHAYDPNYKD